MMQRGWIFLVAVAAAGCGHRAPKVAPAPLTPSEVVAQNAKTADSLFPLGETNFRAGHFGHAQKQLDKATQVLRPGDPRLARARFYLGESYLAQGSQLQAAREFRRVADESGDEQLAPEALLRVGDAYADMWRRPELDPSFAQTAVATYQELQARYPGSPAALRGQAHVAALQEKLAWKEYKAGLYYFRLKAWDSAIIYFKDVVATYPRSGSAPEALVRLVQAYRTIGYTEEIKETCGYMRRFHPNAEGVADACRNVPGA